jgi:hypothetical protein
MVSMAFMVFLDDLGCVGSVQRADPIGSVGDGACRTAMGMAGRLASHDYHTRPRHQRCSWPCGLPNQEEIPLPMAE